MSPPLDGDLVFVTGRGGVGKTPVAAGLARAAPAAGREAIVCEIGGETRVAELLAHVRVPVVELPLLFVPALGPAEVAALARRLRPALG